MNERKDHEPNDVATRRLHEIVAVMVVSLIVILLLVYLLWQRVSSTTTPESGPLPPSPRLQAHPFTDLRVERARQQARLNGYAWVDRDAGSARIPIERAMILLARQQTVKASKESRQ